MFSKAGARTLPSNKKLTIVNRKWTRGQIRNQISKDISSTCSLKLSSWASRRMAYLRRRFAIWATLTQKCSALHQTTSRCTRTMVNKQTTNNLVKIKYLFTAIQKLHLIMFKKLMILTTCLTGSKPQLFPRKHRLMITAILTSISLRMTIPRCCSRFQHFFSSPRAPIRRRQMPSQTVNSSNNNHINYPKFTLLTLPLTATIITNTIITVAIIITAALTEPMNLAISLARPPGLPKRKSLSTKRSDLSSTKKSRKWRRPRCAGTLSCTITASTVTPAHMLTVWMSSCQNSTFHPTIRLKCALSITMKDIVCMDSDASSYTVFMT